MEIKIDFKATLWTSVKAHCPICYKTFTGWYCPSCGLPKKNSKYAIYKGCEDSIHNCDKYHFRPEFSSFENFQLCSRCCTTNPFNAKYCRNCGEDISSQARDINGHGWVDLGLSVLWSTEETRISYMWMRSIGNPWMDISFEEYQRQAMVDSSSHEWGDKWRMPTKEEFEELIEKCVWEKILMWENRRFPPYNEKYQKLKALKITGPNGNHIIILPTIHNTGIDYWTATQSVNYEGRAERFSVKIAECKDEDDSLWLTTPFDKNKAIIMRHLHMEWEARIRPVADKKWKGKL